jgi:hypothetical protein
MEYSFLRPLAVLGYWGEAIGDNLEVSPEQERKNNNELQLRHGDGMSSP